MKRLGFAVAAGLALAPSAPAAAQSLPRDGKLQQALVNTVGASLQRRGYELSLPASQQTIQRFNEAVARASAAGSASPYPVVAEASRTWQQILKFLSPVLPWPQPLGKDGEAFTRAGGGVWRRRGYGSVGRAGLWGRRD